jgi:imidazolonepropionase-like amidohydrolase
MLCSEAMAPWDIIRSATTVNAELVNRTGELGVAAPGARADLIAVDGDPLADISLLDGQGEHLTHIVKNDVFHKTKKFSMSYERPSRPRLYSAFR